MVEISDPHHSTALRTSAAQTAPSGHFFRVVGEDAYEAVDSLVPTDLFLQEAQLRQTLLLDEAGLLLADALVGRDDDAFLLVIDGMGHEAARAWLEAHVAGTHSRIEDLSEAHDAIGLHGPYAWELLGEWLSPDFVGMPYLSTFRNSGVLVMRAGRTGEYGYDVLIPKAASSALLERLSQIGEAFDLGAASEEDMALASLENAFFNIHREGRVLKDPLELQLKWRLSKEKVYRGHEALKGRWAAGSERRITWLTSPAPLAIGQSIELAGEVIGQVVNAQRSSILGSWVAIAVLEKRWACAGIDAFEGAGSPLLTVAPPVINNLSLHVNPQRHGYRERASFAFPEPLLQPL